jgi:hypothetical protein
LGLKNRTIDNFDQIQLNTYGPTKHNYDQQLMEEELKDADFRSSGSKDDSSSSVSDNDNSNDFHGPNSDELRMNSINSSNRSHIKFSADNLNFSRFKRSGNVGGALGPNLNLFKLNRNLIKNS